jgi:hypothetical protein
MQIVFNQIIKHQITSGANVFMENPKYFQEIFGMPDAGHGIKLRCKKKQ